MARIYDFRSSGEIADDVVVGVDREDLDHVVGAERNPFAKFVLKAPMPALDDEAGESWPQGSIGEAVSLSTRPSELYPIDTFTATPAMAERGQALTDILLEWELGCEPELISQQTLTGPGTPPPLSFDDRSAVIPGPLSVDAVWTLTVTGGQGTSNAIVGLAWVDRVFWGRGSATALTEAQVEALVSSELTRMLNEFGFAAGAGYWWIAAPDAYGALLPIDSFNGLQVPFDDMGTLVITNPHGQGVSYRRWRSTYPQVAAGIVLQA